MNNIDLKINEYINENLTNNESLTPLKLAYTLNLNEIMYAEEILKNENINFLCVKKNYITLIKVCYYKRNDGNFIIGLDFDDNVLTIIHSI